LFGRVRNLSNLSGFSPSRDSGVKFSSAQAIQCSYPQLYRVSTSLQEGQQLGRRPLAI